MTKNSGRYKASQEHLGRIERYARMIDEIFQRANKEAAKIGLSTGHTGESLFSFSQYPQIREKIDALLKQMRAEIKTVILNGEQAEWDHANLVNDELVASAFGSRATVENTRFSRYFQRNEEARNAFQQREIGGFTLSQRVWKLTDQYKHDIELALDIGIGDGRSAAQLSRDIRKYLNEPEKLFRRVRDKHGNLVLSQRAKAYHPGQGVYRSSYKNALRLARTEINMAYRTADNARWQELDFIVGFEVRRSNNPYGCVLCESLVGRYPKDFVFTGWHPNCRCFTVPILKTPEEMEADTEKILAGEDPSEESGSRVNDVPDGFKEWIEKNKDRVQGWKSVPYFMRENVKYGGIHEIVINKTRSEAAEFDSISRSIASKLNTTVTPVNIKSTKRIMEKAANDYGGDIGQVRDLIRNTFIAPESKHKQIMEELGEKMKILRVKNQTPESNELGYSGILLNVQMQSGILAEVQINSPGLIYGKHTDAEQLLGNELFNKIREVTGLESGLGHIWYEQWRVLNKVEDQEKIKELKRLSAEYYSALRKLKF